MVEVTQAVLVDTREAAECLIFMLSWKSWRKGRFLYLMVLKDVSEFIAYDMPRLSCVHGMAS